MDVMASDETLIRSFREGRRQAGATLLSRLRPGIAAVCWAVSGNPGIAEEAVQETWLRIVKGLDGYRDGAPVRPWALQIARNATRDLLRKHRPHLSVDDVIEPSGGPAPEAPLLRREQAEHVSRLIEALSPALREVVIMKYALDLDNDAIAAALGIGKDALWARLSRARRTLREKARDVDV
jgi:RNA polymerase sigma-70 factor, ECF subfamily